MCVAQGHVYNCKKKKKGRKLLNLNSTMIIFLKLVLSISVELQNIVSKNN